MTITNSRGQVWVTTDEADELYKAALALHVKLGAVLETYSPLSQQLMFERLALAGILKQIESR